MAEVYLVTKGDYSDYGIYGVFSTREKAEQYAHIISGEVDEWALDDITIPNNIAGKRLYRVFRYADGFIQASRNEYVGQPVEDDSVTEKAAPGWLPLLATEDVKYRLTHPHLYTEVWARDDDHAKKIAADRFARYRAEQDGIGE